MLTEAGVPYVAATEDVILAVAEEQLQGKGAFMNNLYCCKGIALAVTVVSI